MTKFGYATLWIEDKLAEMPSTKLATFMTRPIDPTSQVWNAIDRATRIMSLTFFPWAIWVTYTIYSQASIIDRNTDRWKAHEDFSKEKVAQIERMDREIQEWRVRMASFSEETRAGIRATDVSVRDVGARLGAMADTTSRIQESIAAIREKMVNLQVVTDELNKEKK